MLPSTYSHLTLAGQNLKASVNTIHNCSKHKCLLTKTKAVVQERQLTTKFADKVTHQGDLNDRLLNTAQLCSTDVLLAFRAPDTLYPGGSLTCDQVIDSALKV